MPTTDWFLNEHLSCDMDKLLRNLDYYNNDVNEYMDLLGPTELEAFKELVDKAQLLCSYMEQHAKK